MASEQAPEYHVVIGTGTDPGTGLPCLAFEVQTIREFTSFGYTIEVVLTEAPSESTYHLRIGGLALPTVSRPSSGPARSTVMAALPSDGVYSVQVERKGQQAGCTFIVEGSAPASILERDPGRLVSFDVAVA